MTGARKEYRKNGCVTITLLTPEEAEPYRKLPVGISQNAEMIRSVAEHDGVKYIMDIMADEISRTIVQL